MVWKFSPRKPNHHGESIMLTIQCPTARPVLKLNASGQVVSQLQKALNERLQEIDTISTFPLQVPITGFYGEQTQLAVKYLQCLAFLKIDGIVGANTWAYLCDGGASMPVLRRGALSPLVGQVQQALKNGNFYQSAIDNDFGAKTEAAVKAFQAGRSGLVADGVIGAKTWTELSRFDGHASFCFVTQIGN
jgi:peptidoglycan hydrolase-like protein with peptidoglycan-binding domain